MSELVISRNFQCRVPECVPLRSVVPKRILFVLLATLVAAVSCLYFVGIIINMALAWHPDKKHTDRERWVCIYPAYLNSKKTLAEGRKLAKDKCVENPTHQEIRDVLSAAGFQVGVENKLHPKERSKELLYRGRIRVHLKNDDGTPVNPSFPTRDSLLQHLGSTIPKLKTRQARQTSGDQSVQQSASSSKKGKSKGRR